MRCIPPIHSKEGLAKTVELILFSEHKNIWRWIDNNFSVLRAEAWLDFIRGLYDKIPRSIADLLKHLGAMVLGLWVMAM